MVVADGIVITDPFTLPPDLIHSKPVHFAKTLPLVINYGIYPTFGIRVWLAGGEHSMGSDKREDPRLKRRLTVRFGIDETNRVAFTEDVSRTGMFIKTPNICNPNTRIKITFEIATEKVELEARVMWAKKVPQNLFHLVKKSGMGVRFLRFHSGEDPFNSYFDNTTG